MQKFKLPISNVSLVFMCKILIGIRDWLHFSANKNCVIFLYSLQILAKIIIRRVSVNTKK